MHNIHPCRSSAVILLPVRHDVQYTGQCEDVDQTTQSAGESGRANKNDRLARRWETRWSIHSTCALPCYGADLRQEDGEYNADRQQYHVERKYVVKAGINGIKESVENLCSQDVSE